MKNQILCLLLSLLSLPVFGQQGFSITAGGNIASTSAEDASRVGFHAGLLKRFDLSQKFNWQAEILFTQKGFKDGGQFIEAFDFLFVEQRFDYVSTDIVIGFDVIDNYSLQLGAEGAYLLNARTTLYEQVFKGTAGIDRFDFSLIAGLQFQLDKIGVYARYVHGFTDMRDFSLTDINGLLIGKGEVGTLQTFQLGASIIDFLSWPSKRAKDKVSPGKRIRPEVGYTRLGKRSPK